MVPARPRKYTIKPDDPQIGMSFANYRGQPDLLEHAKLTVGIMRGVKAFEDRGGEMPKGMLLSGSPGTGKTFLAAVIASEANLPFIYIDASSLRGMFWGMTELMIMKLFRDARGLARKYAQPGQRGACIMFMDEIDSIGMNRGGQGNAGGQGMVMGGMMMGGGQGLNTLLNQMDSLTEMVEDRWRYKVLRWFGIVRGPVKSKPLVFVIGATNRPAVLDPALTRPGRWTRILEVHRPGRRRPARHHPALPGDEVARPRDLAGPADQRLDGMDPDPDQDHHQRGPDPRPPAGPRLPHLQGLARARPTSGRSGSSSRSAPGTSSTGARPPITRRATRSRPATSNPRTGSRRRRSSAADTPWAMSSSSRARSGPRSTPARSRPASWSRFGQCHREPLPRLAHDRPGIRPRGRDQLGPRPTWARSRWARPR